MRLVDRDYDIFNEIFRWKCCLSRHIRFLAGFSGQRACDRRLKLLIDNGYIERKRILYGVPAIYFLTYKAKKMLNYPLRKDGIKIEQINHDIIVLDCVIFFHHKFDLPLNKFVSEKEMHSADGFSNRMHRPDFIFHKDNKTYCVEVELNLKAKNRFVKNIEDNFLKYDVQDWIVPSSKIKIIQILEENSISYPNIEIIKLDEILEYIKSL